MSAIEGFNRANGADQVPQPITGDEFDAMLKRHDEFLARRA